MLLIRCINYVTARNDQNALTFVSKSKQCDSLFERRLKV